MAAPADKSVRAMGRATGSDSDYEVPTELNKLIAAFRTLCTKLDNDAGVTDTNYFALCADAAASGPAKVVPS